MALINAYLTFNGNCREAMLFYQRCLGGELCFQTVAEASGPQQMPMEMQNVIVHATLTRGPLVLMASDMTDKACINGSSVSLMLTCDSETELNRYYSRLSSGGRRNHPVEATFWGAVMGDLTDPYGISWLLYYAPENASYGRSI